MFDEVKRDIFSEEHEVFRANCRKFFEKEIAPFHDQWEEDGQVSRECWNKAGETGLLCMSMPNEYGGSEADFLYTVIMAEEQGRIGASGPGFMLHSEIVAPYIFKYGSDEQKSRWLPKMASGELIGAIAMTEPGTGSDLQAIKTTCIKDGDHYVLNGQKVFITNGYMCDLVVVVVKTDPEQGASGTSLVVVEAGMEGFTKGRKLKKIGLKAQDTSELFFENVIIPKENLLGQEGMGFAYLMSELVQERLLIAMGAVSACERILHHTIEYVKNREAFGRPISKFQNTRFKLAELATETKIGRSFVDDCLSKHMNKELDVTTAAMAKLWTTDLQVKLVDECLQLHGGYGYMLEYPVAKAFVDSRIQKIYGGTNEIMKELISRSFL